MESFIVREKQTNELLFIKTCRNGIPKGYRINDQKPRAGQPTTLCIQESRIASEPMAGQPTTLCIHNPR
ncbi:MAG: hypothetical protein GY729_21290 [Desulfobacteraceae bacterium]|nr:hypothetical protein [Desulfobacteraceae bacterium]